MVLFGIDHLILDLLRVNILPPTNRGSGEQSAPVKTGKDYGEIGLLVSCHGLC